MDCREMRELLSEYIDESLEAKTKALVEEHLSACRDCRQEVASLRMLINDLGSMETVAPPKDFLDQLHRRMERRSWFSKILHALSVPMRVKLPMKFAGAAVMAILVLMIFQVQKDRYGTKMAPLVQEAKVGEEHDRKDRERTAQEGVVEFRAPQESEKPEHSPLKTAKAPMDHGVTEEAYRSGVVREKAMPKPRAMRAAAEKDETKRLSDNAVKEIAHQGAKADQPPGKGAPIELSLVTRRDQSSEVLGTASGTEAPRARETKMRRTLTTGEAVPATRFLLPQLREVIERAGGEVVSIEYEEGTRIPESVHVEIPAGQFDTFQHDLKELGELQGAVVGPTGEDEEILPVRIRLLTP